MNDLKSMQQPIVEKNKRDPLLKIFSLNTLSRLNFRRMKECSTILQWLDPQPGEYILDIGCGDGYYDSLIEKKGAKVLGIDIHEKRLSYAQKTYRSENLEFIYMNAEELDSPDETFDKVMSLCVIEHLQHDDRVMQHVSRVLKPGGYFVFSADSLSNPEISPKERSFHQKRYAVNTFYTHENIKEKLARVGLEVMKTQYILNKSFELKLIRLSWKLDDLPKGLGFVRVLGYFTLSFTWKMSTLFSRKTYNPSIGGLTLLVIARKPPTT